MAQPRPSAISRYAWRMESDAVFTVSTPSATGTSVGKSATASSTAVLPASTEAASAASTPSRLVLTASHESVTTSRWAWKSSVDAEVGSRE